MRGFPLLSFVTVPWVATRRLSSFRGFSLRFFFRTVRFRLYYLSLLATFRLSPRRVVRDLSRVYVYLLRYFGIGCSAL